MTEAMKIAGGANTFVDENLYSRQLYVMGHEAQRKMAGASVLIAGLNGLGTASCMSTLIVTKFMDRVCERIRNMQSLNVDGLL
jgi:hypothetical protein